MCTYIGLRFIMPYKCTSILLLGFWLMSTEGYWWWGKVEESWNVKDNVGLENRWKMRNISHELLSRATLHVRHIMDIRDYHKGSVAFEVGYIMGKIREKYRKMMEHYNQWRDKASGKSAFASPGVREIKPIHFLLTMEHIFSYEIEIQKYCDVLMSYFIDDTYPVKNGANINKGIIKQKRQSDALKKREKHRPTSTTPPRPSRRWMEQALKRSYRQRHLNRKLGLPENSTTPRKRFKHNWPVEGSWDFGPYDIGI